MDTLEASRQKDIVRRVKVGRNVRKAGTWYVVVNEGAGGLAGIHIIVCLGIHHTWQAR